MINQANNNGIDGQNKKLSKAFAKLQKLVEALNKKDIPAEIGEVINQEIASIDSFTGTDRERAKKMNKAHSLILQLVKKKLGFVPKGHYTGVWIAIGLSAMGVPFGLIWMTVTGNPGFFAVGIGMGLPIGLAIGASMDKKAEKEGKQLSL